MKPKRSGMTSEEIKKAWFDQIPVFNNGIRYNRINALIYRLDRNKKIVASAELLDQNGSSVVIVKFDDVEVEKTI